MCKKTSDLAEGGFPNSAVLSEKGAGCCARGGCCCSKNQLTRSFSMDRPGKEEELEELQRKVLAQQNIVTYATHIFCEQVEVYQEKLDSIREQYKLGMDTLENRIRTGI